LSALEKEPFLALREGAFLHREKEPFSIRKGAGTIVSPHREPLQQFLLRWENSPTECDLLKQLSSLATKTLRAIVPVVSANPSPGRAHDPSWGIWPYTVLKSQTT